MFRIEKLSTEVAFVTIFATHPQVKPTANICAKSYIVFHFLYEMYNVKPGILNVFYFPSSDLVVMETLKKYTF